MGDAWPLTLQDAAAALRDGSVTSVALVTQALARADRHDRWLGAFVTRLPQPALEQARRADAELAAGVDRGPLHGIPMAVKDVFATRDAPTTAQSTVLDPGWGGGEDAVAVGALRDAGAVLMGKTTMMEFGLGRPEAGKPFPIPVNPWRRTCWAGGSSSGSASGVAAGFFHAALGTDTGGSVRWPAAFCGVTGLMPTFGRVSTAGCVPLSASLDRVGVLARSAWDSAAVLDAIATPPPGALGAIGAGIAGMAVGVARDRHLEGACTGIAEAFERSVATLAGLGADVREVTLPAYDDVLAAWLATMTSEAHAYHRADLAARWDDYTVTARGRLSLGAQVSRAQYDQAQEVRRACGQQLARLLRDVRLIVTPTATMTAPAIASQLQLATRPAASGDERLHTIYWSAVPNPVLSVPIGFVDGLPIGMQLAAAPLDEATLLAAGHAYQQQTDWHRRVPDLEAEG